jgi:hypothetical protein
MSRRDKVLNVLVAIAIGLSLAWLLADQLSK